MAIRAICSTDLSHSHAEFSIGERFNGAYDEDHNRQLSAEGYCEDEHKTIVCSYMSLNRCFDNANGRLIPNTMGTGRFYNNCRNCHADDPLQAGWLFCDCWGTLEDGIMNEKGWAKAAANMSESSMSLCAMAFKYVTYIALNRQQSLRRRERRTELRFPRCHGWTQGFSVWRCTHTRFFCELGQLLDSTGSAAMACTAHRVKCPELGIVIGKPLL